MLQESVEVLKERRGTASTKTIPHLMSAEAEGASQRRIREDEVDVDENALQNEEEKADQKDDEDDDEKQTNRYIHTTVNRARVLY